MTFPGLYIMQDGQLTIKRLIKWTPLSMHAMIINYARYGACHSIHMCTGYEMYTPR